ncbi:hypothetical protein LshimejAT787_0701610 [Lyophyllum shimeji]|uniref:G domain-containing protein n=1 Tax=Lyophyllum shimeji TaxID=47721 RepID=A0A9P3PQ01_LYOSH|nr:hypothetical protein LshimejAT787_0701610 [Lyophyllum shimeji]
MSSRSKGARKQYPEPRLDPYIPQDNDTIILVLGQIGAGKSTFINSAIGFGREFASVGHDMGGSHTKDIQAFHIAELSTAGRRIVLVDTPGFNETTISDRQTLQRVVSWLNTCCKPTTTFAGIIYVYEIVQPRLLPGADYMHPTKFSGSPIAQHIVLATVKWTELPKDRFAVGEHREREMKTWLGNMPDNESRVIRFLDNSDSAQSMVALLCRRGTTVAFVMGELIKLFGVLPSTAKPADSGKGRKDTASASLEFVFQRLLDPAFE